jgi:hypothetical protein
MGMAIAITMRIAARGFFVSTETTQGTLLCPFYTHITHTPKSRCVFCGGFEDTTKMSAPSRATGQADLAGDRVLPAFQFQQDTHALLLSTCPSHISPPSPLSHKHAMSMFLSDICYLGSGSAVQLTF